MSDTQPNNNQTLEYAAELTHLGVIQLSGEERVKYLQGQVTADINQLSPNKAQLACHCDFKGKMWSTLKVVSWQDSILLITHKSVIERSLAELKKYGVFAKVEIQEVSDQWILSAGKGQAFVSQLTEIFTQIPTNNLECVSSDQGLVISFTQPEPRYLVLQPAQSNKLLKTTNNQSGNLWELDQIKSGYGQIESTSSNEYIPQMLNLQALGAIDFEKGCYMGQEVVARTKYLGRNKRAGFILKTEGSHQNLAGEQLEYQVGENWRPGGKVLNSATDGKATWAFAVLPNDLASGEKLRVKSTPDTILVTQSLPYELQ
ncbi:tRNA-modifying protein YgfZ [Paraglaciecola aestuariivivens]